jgi:hypothetical protein
MIGGNVDLDLLSLFPQKDARIMGGMGRGLLFIGQLEISPLEATFPKNSGVYLRQKFWPWGGISAPGAKFLPPTKGCTTAREKGLSEISQGQKLWNFCPPKIPTPGAEFPAWEKTSIRKRL